MIKQAEFHGQFHHALTLHYDMIRQDSRLAPLRRLLCIMATFSLFVIQYQITSQLNNDVAARTSIS